MEGGPEGEPGVQWGDRCVPHQARDGEEVERNGKVGESSKERLMKWILDQRGREDQIRVISRSLGSTGQAEVGQVPFASGDGHSWG